MTRLNLSALLIAISLGTFGGLVISVLSTTTQPDQLTELQKQILLREGALSQE